MTTKQQIIDALRSFAAQRSGIEFGNYGDVKAFRAEQRSITKDLHQARELLRAVELRDSITVECLRQAFSAYSGRLTLVDTDEGGIRLEYCTGQYFPTEYRRAVCAVCAAALWAWMRDECMPKPVHMYGHSSPGYIFNGSSKRPAYLSAGDWLRRSFRREFGRTIANRWFD